MSADPGVPKPGSKYGPCLTPCHHRDCALSMSTAVSICRLCGKPIGYETRYYRDEQLGSGEWVHAYCFEDAVERELEARA